MKLVATPGSPYGRKARIVLAEKKIEYEFIDEAPGKADSRVPSYNPLGKVPVLVLDDESTVFDSRVIVEYLDAASPVSRLIPDDTRSRIQVRRWEALADGCTDAIVAIIYEKRRAADKQDPAVIARQRGKIERAVGAMAQELGAKTWCTGEFFNLADIAVGCALGFLDARLPDVSWRADHANLVKLYDKLMQRPSFKETMPPV
jgi:glutathione S-transferase